MKGLSGFRYWVLTFGLSIAIFIFLSDDFYKRVGSSLIPNGWVYFIGGSIILLGVLGLLKKWWMVEGSNLVLAFILAEVIWIILTLALIRGFGDLLSDYFSFV